MATPIGNLGDLSPRAREVLAAAAIVAAEDTRTTRKLLPARSTRSSFVSLTEHNVELRAPELVAAARDSLVALVSDAGTPAIADPGARLVTAAHEAGVGVFAIPGPSALAAAISVSGCDGSDVHFLGFLPRRKGDRIARLRQAGLNASTVVFYESPTRLGRTLGELSEALDDPTVTVCRELTKLHEEAVRGRASELQARFSTTRGECTVVVDTPHIRPASDASEAREFLAAMRRAGARRSSAAVEAARRHNLTRDAAYRLWDEV